MYSNENGFVARSFEEIIDQLRMNLNEEIGTNYNNTTLIASNWYRIFYILAQEIIRSENTFAAGFDNLRNFINSINYRINNPVTLLQTLIDRFQNELNLTVNFKQATESTAGMIFMSIDTTETEFENRKEEIGNLLIENGIINYFFAGSKHWYQNLPNGQQWRFAVELPEMVEVKVHLYITKSRINAYEIDSDETIKQKFMDNFTKYVAIGKDIEWERIINVTDLGWASIVNITYCRADDITETYTNKPLFVDYNQKGYLPSSDNITITIYEANE